MRTADYYHCSLKPISRSAGRSAVACAAYRTGSKLDDKYYGTERDFSRKKDVVTSFTTAPADAPGWAFDTESLWNAVEAKENRKNSQLAFEWEVALPNELSPEQREAIAHSFTDWLVEEYGVAVTAGIHNGGNRGNGLNDHMHVMMTTRELAPEGWAKNKLRDFNVRPGQTNPEVERVREHVAELINSTLEDAGSDERVDHRSFKTRGIEREPTTHLGPKATALERLFGSDRGDANREIAAANRALIEERLAWQAGVMQAQQEVVETTTAIDRELAQRFGDSFAETLHQAEAGAEAGGVVEQATQDAVPLQADITDSARVDFLPQPRGWLARMEALRESAVDFWQDSSSGGDPDAVAGKWQHLVGAVRHTVSGWSHRDGKELAQGLTDIAKIAAQATDTTATPPGAPADNTGGTTSWVERHGREALHRLGDVVRDERGSLPPADEFDRLAAEYAASSGGIDDPLDLDAPETYEGLTAPEAEPGPQREGPDMTD